MTMRGELALDQMLAHLGMTMSTRPIYGQDPPDLQGRQKARSRGEGTFEMRCLWSSGALGWRSQLSQNFCSCWTKEGTWQVEGWLQGQEVVQGRLCSRSSGP